MDCVPLRNKDGHALHIAATALIYYALRTSILQHGSIALHSVTRMDTLFTSPQRHSFTTPFGPPFCNTDRLPQQGWTRSSHRSNGTHLLRPSGIHSTTRMDKTALRSAKDGPVLHIAATALIYYAPRASILQHGWTGSRSATRMDSLPHIAATALIYYTLRASILQHGWMAFQSATRMDTLPHITATALNFYTLRALIPTRMDRVSTPQQACTRFFTSLQRHSSPMPLGHPFCNTDGLRSLRNKKVTLHIAPTILIHYAGHVGNTDGLHFIFPQQRSALQQGWTRLTLPQWHLSVHVRRATILQQTDLHPTPPQQPSHPATLMAIPHIAATPPTHHALRASIQ